MFLCLLAPDPDPLVRGMDQDQAPDPDPLVRGMDQDQAPDPDPSIIRETP
jgi:hypothetical protein